MFTLTLCIDCAIYAANNDDSGASPEWRDSVDYSLLSHVAVDPDTEQLSATKCDACQDTLYGTRMEATDMWPTMAHEYGKRDAASSGLTVEQRAEIDPLSDKRAGDMTPLALFTRATGLTAEDYAHSDYVRTLDVLCYAYEQGYYA